jgi:hypothetical protein
MMRGHNQHEDAARWSLTAYPLSWPADWKRGDQSQARRLRQSLE